MGKTVWHLLLLAMPAGSPDGGAICENELSAIMSYETEIDAARPHAVPQLVGKRTRLIVCETDITCGIVRCRFLDDHSNITMYGMNVTVERTNVVALDLWRRHLAMVDAIAKAEADGVSVIPDGRFGLCHGG